MYSLLVLALFLGYVRCDPFSASLTSYTNIFKIGQDVLIEITIFNQNDEDLFLLTRGTPFEGFKSDIFLVTLNGTLIPYSGLHYKRGPIEMESNGINIPAKGSVSVELDISSAYELKFAGKYSVRLNALVNFEDGAGMVSKPKLTSEPFIFTLIDEGDNPKLTIVEKLHLKEAKYVTVPSMNGRVAGYPSYPETRSCGVTKISELKSEWLRAYKSLGSCSLSIKNDPKHFSKWFGSFYDEDKNNMANTFRNMQAAMEKSRVYILSCGGTYCRSGDFAYTSYDSRYIYLCSQYFKTDLSAKYDTRFGTLIHELSHTVSHTSDHTYGTANCLDLAQKKPRDAMENADNLEYFNEFL